MNAQLGQGQFECNTGLSDRDNELIKHIEQNPGIRYRELSRLTGYAHGVLSYHLVELQRVKAILIERKSRQTRFFPLTFSDKESAIVKHLRSKPDRQIILILLEHQKCSFRDLIKYTGKAQSTISEHLKNLRESGLVSVRHGEYCSLYSLKDNEIVAELISKYKSSFADRIVENYAEVIGQL
jgi:predicted transcriptional regulator